MVFQLLLLLKVSSSFLRIFPLAGRHGGFQSDGEVVVRGMVDVGDELGRMFAHGVVVVGGCEIRGLGGWVDDILVEAECGLTEVGPVSLAAGELQPREYALAGTRVAADDGRVRRLAFELVSALEPGVTRT